MFHKYSFRKSIMLSSHRWAQSFGNILFTFFGTIKVTILNYASSLKYLMPFKSYRLISKSIVSELYPDFDIKKDVNFIQYFIWLPRLLMNANKTNYSIFHIPCFAGIFPADSGMSYLLDVATS